jgi:hypothetical protein
MGFLASSGSSAKLLTDCRDRSGPRSPLLISRSANGPEAGFEQVQRLADAFVVA